MKFQASAPEPPSVDPVHRGLFFLGETRLLEHMEDQSDKDDMDL